jgi:formylglycine-generating enzyme required for sulfatase activity
MLALGVSVVIPESAHADPKAGDTKTISGMEFVYIPAGSFLMGSPNSDCGCKGCSERERPRHKVTVSAFWMGKYEVTQAQYEKITGSNYSQFKGDSRHPVEQVRWYDAVEFCNRFSVKAGLTPCYTIDRKHRDPANRNNDDIYSWTTRLNEKANGFRLPNEAEWEYACKAGSTTEYYWGDRIDGDYLWYGGNSNRTTHPVGEKRPNAWGLFDMAGNVREWCYDWYKYDYYTVSPERNPMGPGFGMDRIARGGSWYYEEIYQRSAFRSTHVPSFPNNDVGFRVVIPAGGK